MTFLQNQKKEESACFTANGIIAFVIVDKEKPIAIMIGYEREAENNDQYPQNTIYISELAVDEKYQRQGLAKQLLKAFLDEGEERGLLHLQGEVSSSVQTNSADWNNHVINLYKSFGFVNRATKTYDNRTDVVLGLEL